MVLRGIIWKSKFMKDRMFEGHLSIKLWICFLITSMLYLIGIFGIINDKY